MAFNEKLSELSPVSVLATEKLLAAYINETFPDLDITAGSVHRDLIVNLYAALEQRIRDGLDESLRSNSLLEITKDPTLADDTQVDRVLSNYNITRSQGAKASGYVRVNVEIDSTTLVPAGTSLTMQGVEFVTTASTRAVGTGETISQTGDVNLVLGIGGLYFFTVPVEAVNVGFSANIKEGSKVSAMVPKVTGIVNAESAQTFLGGKDVETNVELLSKLKQGIIGHVLGGRVHIEAKLKSEFPYVISAGATGFGDPEMTRDVVQTDEAATHRGGTVDIHARTAHYPLAETVSVTGTNIAETTRYEFQLTREQCNGLYTVSQVKETGSTDIGSLCIVEYDRTIDLPTSNPIPNINTGLDLGFSSYQKVRIVVDDPSNTGTYDVELLKMPNIDTLQDFVTYGEDRSVGADMVVKGAVPVFCGCSIHIVKPIGSPDINISDIQIAVANNVNGVPFGRAIPISIIAHTVHDYLPENAYVDLPVRLFGNLYYPDKPKFLDIDNGEYAFGDANYDTGTPDVVQIRSTDVLRAPNHPERGVSSKTVAFFLNPYAINITVSEV